jgi:hypothetical protein
MFSADLVSFRRCGARDGSCAILGAVRRAFLVLLLAMLTFNVSGLAAVCGDAPCDDESCPGDLSGGECAPNCHFCSCCSLPKVAASTTVVLVAPGAHMTSWIRSVERLPSPEPADILHVPKLLLA